MRSLKKILPLLFIAAASCTSLRAPQPAHFKILQINDVYKIEGLQGGQLGGLARVRTLRRHLESDGTPVLILHAGDALYPSVMSKYLDAKPMVDVLNLLDGDPNALDPRMAVTLGNHELDKSDDQILMARLADSQFIWVASNTLHCTAPDACVPLSRVARNVAEVLTMNVGGTQVGLLGLLYPMQKSYARTYDRVEAATDAVQALRGGSGAKVVLALTHEDMADDVALAQKVLGINIIIGGHDHLFAQKQVGGVWITKADADAKSVIVYDVIVPPDGPIVTTPLRVVMDETIPKDPMVDAAVQRWMSALSVKLGGNDTLGQTRTLLEGVEPAVRGRETALGNLLADVARAQMQTDAAIINGGSIRINDDIPPGPITRYDMEGIFYYANKLVAFTATGQQILDILRNSVSRVDAGDGRFLQVSGIRFKYHARGGTFAIDASDVEIGGKPLDLNGRYTVATIDYLYLHGTEDGYTLFADATRPPKVNAEREADFRGTVEAYIRRAGTVDQAIEGRIVRAP